jgi:hypothetical protein
VTVTDERDAAGTAATSVAVTAAPQPPAPPQPPGGNPPAQPRVFAAPLFGLPRTGNRGVTFRVTCKDACNVGATLQVDARTKRKARLRSRTLARLSLRPLRGARKYQVLVPKRLRAKLRGAHKSKLKVVLVVTARVTGGPTKVARRTVSLRL